MGYPPGKPQDVCLSATPPPRCQTPNRPSADAKAQARSSHRLLAAAHLATGALKPLAPWRLSTTLPSDPCPLEPALFHGTRPGWIEVIAGVMFSGKSEELVRRVRRAGVGPKPGRGLKRDSRVPLPGRFQCGTPPGGTAEGARGGASDGVG